MNQPGKENRNRFVYILIAILIASVLILAAYIDFEFNKREEMNIEYRYQIEIFITGNLSTVNLFVPLPHDLNISKEIPTQYQINDTEYGKIVKINTKNYLELSSSFKDDTKLVNPDLSFSTQNENMAYIFLNKSDPNTNVSIKIYLERSYQLKMAFSDYAGSEYLHDYIVIANAFQVSNLSTTPDSPDIIREEPSPLSNGWNEILVQNGSWYFD